MNQIVQSSQARLKERECIVSSCHLYPRVSHVDGWSSRRLYRQKRTVNQPQFHHLLGTFLADLNLDERLCLSHNNTSMYAQLLASIPLSARISSLLR